MLPRIFHFSRMHSTLCNGSHMASMPMNNLSSEWSVNLTPQGQTCFQRDFRKSLKHSWTSITTENPSELWQGLLRVLDYIISSCCVFLKYELLKIVADFFDSLPNTHIPNAYLIYMYIYKTNL